MPSEKSNRHYRETSWTIAETSESSLTVPAGLEAADAGRALAQYALAQAYNYGTGVPKDDAQAVKVTGDYVIPRPDSSLDARVPNELPPGQVRLIVLLPGEDDAGGIWAHGIAAEWSAELQDPREDIYTLDDGQPLNAPR